ncbi:hypothetical protein [Actinopolymorpha alba]|uniref:hypothetical protein n=1 Tax=Actinopolymorpha alba TaxID=533267 RepID=UPI000371B7B9|nr:hypothetical protein [Actinopolymorpha alba]
MEIVLGVFSAVSTRDGEARRRHGQPFFEANELGVDARGERLFEIRFADGLWILAVESDLDPVPCPR